MKKLLGLLVLWLIITIHLAYNNYVLNEYKQDDLQRRAFIVYSKTFGSCIVGGLYSNPNINYLNIYYFCREKAFYDKEIYLKEWENK